MRATLVCALIPVLGCSGQSPSSTQTGAPAATETTTATSTERVASVAITSAMASASAAPRASATAGPLDSGEAERRALTDLSKLDAKMLEALSAPEGVARTPTSDVLSGSSDLDLALRGRGGSLQKAGDGGAVTGGGRLAAIGENNAPPAKIAGKKPGEATADDVAKAILQAGCAASRQKDDAPLAVFEVVCEKSAFVVTFVAKGVTLDATKLAALEKDAAVFTEDGMRLIVRPAEGVSLAAARTLSNKLHGDPRVVELRGTVAIQSAKVTGGAVYNASAVVAGMAAGFRRCFNRALKDDPSLKGGALELTLELGPSGEVLKSTSAPGSALPKPVVDCVQGRGASAQFAPPEGAGPTTITVPLTFRTQ